jgi:hypothetical protein
LLGLAPVPEVHSSEAPGLAKERQTRAARCRDFPEADVRHSSHFVCRNYQRLGGGHVYSARKLLDLKPDFICPNHFEWSAATRETLDSYLRTSEEIQDIWRRFIDQPDPAMGVDNNWVSFYPYQSEAGVGDTIQYELRFRNIKPWEAVG